MTIFKFPAGKKKNYMTFLILGIDDENLIFFAVEV